MLFYLNAAFFETPSILTQCLLSGITFITLALAYSYKIKLKLELEILILF